MSFCRKAEASDMELVTARQRYGGGYDSRSHRRHEMFPAPGMRGKYGADIAIKGAALSGAFLSCDRPN